MSDVIFKCGMCDETEESCQCPKYCQLCQNPESVRLCGDGIWYCYDCRQACEYKTQDEV